MKGANQSPFTRARPWLIGMASLCFFATSITAQAAGTGKLGFGLLLGLAFPNTSSSAFAWGFQGVYRVSPAFGVKAFYQRYGVSISSTADPVTVNDSTSHGFYGAEADYYFPGAPGQFHLGLRLGMSNNSITTSSSNGTTSLTIDNSQSNLFVAPVLAYDQPIGIISVGGELSYAFAFGDNAPKALTLVGTARFWF